MFLLRVTKKEITPEEAERYAKIFDKVNFDNIKNDEFKRNKYLAQAKEKILGKLNSLDFEKEYYMLSASQIGEYNFTDQSFPFASVYRGFDYPGNLPTGWIININYFNYKLKMPAGEAENFINSRKMSGGYVERKIETHVCFTFVNQPMDRPNGLPDFITTQLIFYVTRLVFYDKGKQIGAIYPTRKFDDPVSGFKVTNGTDTLLFNAEHSEGTNCIATRVNGQSTGPVYWYNAKTNVTERIVYANYFFPTAVNHAGDDVLFNRYNDGAIPYQITQYSKTGKELGYSISFDPLRGYALISVIETDENGKKQTIYPKAGAKTLRGIPDLPLEIQSLIRKYDTKKFYLYSDQAASASVSPVAGNNAAVSTPAKENDGGNETLNALSGTWSGKIVQGLVSYQVSIDCSGEKKSCLLNYPGLGCSGTWEMENKTNTTFDFRERITPGKGGCKDGGLIKATLTGNHQLECVYYNTSGNRVIARGTLSK